MRCEGTQAEGPDWGHRKDFKAVRGGRAGSLRRCDQSVKVCKLRVRIEASVCWRAEGERNLDHCET